MRDGILSDPVGGIPIVLPTHITTEITAEYCLEQFVIAKMVGQSLIEAEDERSVIGGDALIHPREAYG